MDKTEWDLNMEDAAKFDKLVSDPVFFDKYDCSGREILVGSPVSSSYTYRYEGGTIAQIEGTVTRISAYGVDIVSSQYLNNFCEVPGGALKLERKEELASGGSVWRMANAKGEGPYCFKGRTTLEKEIEDFDKVIWGHIYDSCGVVDSLNTFLHPGPIEDKSIGIVFFGWKDGEPINKHEMYSWDKPLSVGGALFGFLSEAQAKAWFPEDAREVLSWFGYSLNEVQAAKIIAKSGHQCVYLPA